MAIIENTNIYRLKTNMFEFSDSTHNRLISCERKSLSLCQLLLATVEKMQVIISSFELIARILD